MTRQNYFKNKSILITGGSSGIGFALADRLLAYEPRTIHLVSHEAEKLKQAANKLKKSALSTEILISVTDISDANSIAKLHEKVISDVGVPDIIVNNAGYAHYRLFHEMSEDEIVRHADVNFIGAMRVVRAFLPAMRRAGRGQIVNIASIAGHMLIIPNLVYAAAKHAMVAWSEGLAAEVNKDGITVQTISPGRVLTDFFRHESFQTRIAGAETRLTVSMDKLITISINAIIKRKKLVIIPAYWALVAWAIRSFPWIIKPLYFRLLKRRLARIKN